MSNPFDALAQFSNPAPAAAPKNQPSANQSSGSYDDDTQAKLDSGDFVMVNGRLLPRTKVWLNPTVTLKGTDSEGKPKSISVQLPKGLPIDTMQKMAIKPTDSPAYREKAEANNYFLDLMTQAGLSLEPGASRTIMLECEISRVNDTKVEPSAPGENGLITQLDAMFRPKDKKSS